MAGFAQNNPQDLNNARLMAMRTREIKYICNFTGQQQEMYDILSDPSESRNIYLDKPQLAKSYFKNIQDTIGGLFETDVTEIDPKVLEQLKTLGYLGGDKNTE